MLFGQDIRLVFLLILNAAVLGAAIYAARRWTRDALQRWIDALLIWYVVQYLAIGLPGLMHCLSATSMSITALLLAGAMAWAVGYFPATTADPAEAKYFHAAIFGKLFLITFLVALIVPQRWLPVTDSDALTYHVPAAVQWMASGRISLLPVWFFNPANTFSPLAGSTFIFWLLAPLHSDALLRFVELPAIVLAFLAMVQLGKCLRIAPWAAVVLALAATTSRLASSEIINPRDDMFLVAFVLVALSGFASDAARDRLGPWRIGIALGLSLATKYTAMVSLPLFLLLWGAKRRASWKQNWWFICLVSVLVLAGPWYVRNIYLTGNPLYPLRIEIFGRRIFDGLMVAQTSQRLRSFAGLRNVFVAGYHGLPVSVAILLAFGWAGAALVTARRWREPLLRTCVWGPLLCIALFIAKSPYGEVRFIYPAIFVLFTAIGLFGASFKCSELCQVALAVPLLAASLYTSSVAKDVIAAAVSAALVLCGVGYLLLRVDQNLLEHRVRIRAYAAIAAILVFAFTMYVQWNSYVAQCRIDQFALWTNTYPTLTPSWEYLSKNTPSEAVVAYTQTYLIFPLYGDEMTRRPIYAPVRPDTTDFLHLPRLPSPISGEAINDAFTTALNAPADPAVWRHRLTAAGAEYLFIFLEGPVKQPPELEWASGDAKHFLPVFRDKSAAIYRIQW